MRALNTSIIKLLIIAFVVLVLSVLIAKGQTVGSTEATYYHTGGLDLKIDSRTYYNGVLQPQLSWKLKNLSPTQDQFFSFDDVKPGDTGTNTISLHLKKNAGYVCLDFKNLEDKENGINEPEGIEDGDNDGELSQELEFFAWRDDGDMKFEPWEQPLFGVGTGMEVLKGATYAIADKTTPAPLWPYQTYYLGVYWCAGDLDVDLATGAVSCDAEAMGNEAQTDSMTLDVSLRAVVAKQQPWFSCVPKEPVPDPCEAEESAGANTFSQNNWKKDPCKENGNNGHGNDDDHNDDSNPGHSNDEDDDTDDDGTPGNGNNGETNEWDGRELRDLRDLRDEETDEQEDQESQATQSATKSGSKDTLDWEQKEEWQFGFADVRSFVSSKLEKARWSR